MLQLYLFYCKDSPSYAQSLCDTFSEKNQCICKLFYANNHVAFILNYSHLYAL